MPKIDIDSIPVDARTGYPEPFNRAVQGRSRKRLGNAVGLDQFGVNLTTLKPGTWSSQRHWQHTEDELVYVLAGELVLVEDSGETVLRAGDAAGWKAGTPDGHCLINRSQVDAVYIEIGSRHAEERVTYPDIDMQMVRDASGGQYLRKNGEPYPK